jgi:hypothetical protein
VKAPCATANTMDYAAILALFLLAKTGSVLGRWVGRLTANEQRELFGRAMGKGRIVVDGEEETISNLVSVCFGQDYDYRNLTKWSAL